MNLGGRDAGIGIDHNPDAVAAARARGLVAFLPEEFARSSFAGDRFDSLLFSHVLEHMSSSEAKELVANYLPHLRAGGRVVTITPQEVGFRSDSTHVEFFDLDDLAELARALDLEPVRSYSFPFPRPVGRIFKHNEFVLVAESSGNAAGS